ncbi:MAG: hypothetical protein ABL886_07420 [Rhodoglobus sp.]
MRMMTTVACVLVGAVSAGSCSSDSTVSTTERQSFACIEAIAMTGLTTGTPAGVARDRLTPLSTDESLTAQQRSYFGDLLAALDGLPADAAIDALNGVPCNLD